MSEPRALLLASAAIALLIGPSGSAAQEESPWKSEAELGASLFFGNTSQATFTTRLATESADSAREIGLHGNLTYGEASDDQGEAFVNKRSWKLGASLDYRPFQRVSPFLFAELESAFERRIDLRYDFGIGGKVTLLRSDRSRLDFSGALLGEKTEPDAVAAADVDDDLLARWSFRARARRSWEEGRLTFETQSFYRPRFDAWSDFTFNVTSSLAFALAEAVSLKVTFVDHYDSEAESRGARTNNDGQLFVSLLSSFE
jgi:hypothetical protein